MEESTTRFLPVPTVAPDWPSVRLLGARNPFTTRLDETFVEQGGTITDLLDHAGLDHVLDGRAGCVVMIGDSIIPRRFWRLIRPKAGVTINYRVVPRGGGGGKSIIRIIASLVLVVAAAIAAPYLAGLIAVPGTTLFAVSQAVISGVILVGGNLLLNALIPPPKQAAPPNRATPEADPLSPGITGSSNILDRYGVVPKIVGKHKVYPKKGVTGYTEVVGHDQYLRDLFVVGYAPLNISDIRIGNTPISEFEDFEVLVTKEYGPGDDLTIYTADVFEEALSVTLDTTFQTRTTAANTTEIMVDITFPSGLVEINTETGAKENLSVPVEVEYSVTGAETWVSVGTTVITEARTAAVRRTIRVQVTEGQYDVRVRRTTNESTSTSVADKAQWTALRSIQPDAPLNFDVPLTIIEIRGRGTEQLNGVIQTLSCIAESEHETYDGGWSVTPEVTRNPAWEYVDVLTGNANKAGISRATRIDTDAFVEWAAWCVANGFSCDHVFDEAGDLFSALQLIAAAGRARPHFKDGLFSITRDIPQTVPAQMFTPRNSWGFEAEKVFSSEPHGLKCRFINKDADYVQDERIVYDDGYDEATATEFEAMDFPGVTDPDQIWKLGRYHIAVNKLRPETYRLRASLDFITCNQGDYVKAAHDVILVGLGWGRVVEVFTSGTDVTGVRLDETVTMEAGKSYGLHFRLSDGSQSTFTVDTAAGDTASLTFTSAIPDTQTQPEPGDLVTFGIAGSEAGDYIVKSIEHEEDFVALLTLLDYAPGVHTAADGTIPDFDSNITVPSDPAELVRPPAPKVLSIRSDESVLVYQSDGSLQVRVVLTLESPGASTVVPDYVQVRYRIEGAQDYSFSPLIPADGRDVAITDVVETETYEIEVRYVQGVSNPSKWTSAGTHTVVGKTTPPPDVETLYISGGVATWSYPSPPIDHDGFLVRYNIGSDRVWSRARNVVEDGFTTRTEADVTHLPRYEITILVKAVDKGGNVSANAASMVLNSGDPLVENVIEEIDHHADGFTAGSVTGGTVDGGTGDLVASDGSGFWNPDGGATFWQSGSVAFWPASNAEVLSYVYTYLPLPSDVGARVTLAYAFEGEPQSLLFTPAGTAPAWSGDDGAPAWSDDDALAWSTALPINWPGYWDIANLGPLSWTVTLGGGQSVGRIAALKVQIDVDDVIERLDDVSISVTTGTRLSLTKTFRSIDNISLTLQDDGGSAVRAAVVDKDVDLGPLVKCYDASGAVVAGSVDVTVQGY